MAILNFDIKSSLLPTDRRDFPLTDPTILRPGTTSTLYDGEWLKLDAQSGKPTLVRGANEETSHAVYPVWYSIGATDVQAVGKVPIIYISRELEVVTRVCDTANLNATGQQLVVKDVTVDGNTKRGLAKASGNGQHTIYAYYLGPGKLYGISGSTGIIRAMINPASQITI
jgi:hypothetical protein